MSTDNMKLALAAAGGAAAAVVLMNCCKCSKAGGACPVSGKTAADNNKAAEEPSESKDIYETRRSALQYMEFHFTPSAKLFEPYNPDMKVRDAFDFTIRLARKFDKFKPAKAGRALDLGCAVGMSAFEMSRSFDEVVGIDLSNIFIEYAKKMAVEKRAVYEGPNQGLTGVARDIKLDPSIDVSKVRFEVGDALAVDPKLGKFDGLLAANLVCRVPEPEKLLRSFEGLLNKGGILVLVSPYSWWEGATSQDKWVGGKPGQRSEDVVKKMLSEWFDLLDEQNEPFLIRDHHRRFQLGFSHCTVWRRK